MAKQVPVKPQAGYSPGYTWMLLFTLIAMIGGAALHYLELDGDYGGMETNVPAKPAPKLTPLGPKPVARAPVDRVDDRAAVPPVVVESPAVAALPAPTEPSPRFVGPVVVQMPQLFSLPAARR